MNLQDLITAQIKFVNAERERQLVDWARSHGIDTAGTPAAVVEAMNARIRAVWGQEAQLVFCTDDSGMESWVGVDTGHGAVEQIGPRLVINFSVG